MNKKLLGGLVLIIIIVGVILIARNSSVTQTKTDPIRIGAILSLTGFASPWGEFGKNGIDLAVKTINDAGGIHGRLVEVIVEDDHTEGKDALSAYTKLQSVNDVDGVIGGVFDFLAQPIMPLAEQRERAFISPSNFRIAGGFDLNDQSFVMMTDFSTVIRHLKEYLAQSKIKKLAVVHFKSTFGDEIAKTLKEVSTELGKGNIVDESYTEIGNNDFKTTIAKLKAQNVDGVFLDMVGNDPLNFLTRAQELGFNPTIITYNGTLDSFVNEKDKSLLENVVILNWEVTSSQFTELYQKAYGIPPTKSADKFFDAVYVMATAIAENEDLSKVSEYIENNSFTTPNSTVTFTTNHTVSSTNVVVQVFKNGFLREWK
jgi:branched-chain amino acid transport system substrate-binding protein